MYEHRLGNIRHNIKTLIVTVVYVVKIAAALVEFQVGQHSRFNPYVETPALSETYRHPCKTHLPTVQVSCECHRTGSQFHRLEVKTSVEVETEFRGQIERAIETECLRDSRAQP